MHLQRQYQAAHRRDPGGAGPRHRAGPRRPMAPTSSRRRSSVALPSCSSMMRGVPGRDRLIGERAGASWRRPLGAIYTYPARACDGRRMRRRSSIGAARRWSASPARTARSPPPISTRCSSLPRAGMVHQAGRGGQPHQGDRGRAPSTAPTRSPRSARSRGGTTRSACTSTASLYATLVASERGPRRPHLEGGRGRAVVRRPKNGALAAEAMVFFDKSLADEIVLWRSARASCARRTASSPRSSMPI